MLSRSWADVCQGERAWVVVQPDYAFGTDGHASFAIAPNELIVYDLKLVDCEKVCGTKGFTLLPTSRFPTP